MESSRARGRVLVVDHDEAVLKSFATHLEDNRYDVVTTTSASQVLDLVSEQNIDLVLLDMLMPESTGPEMVTQLREEYSRAELPIIVNSTSQSTTDIVNTLTAGANDYVDKNIDARILLARIETNVSLKRTHQEFLQANRMLLRMQQKMEHDLEAAARIQQEQMPDPRLSIEGWEVAWDYTPCDALGGDSLNIIHLDDENWAFYVLDVSGHGVPASLLAVSLNRLLSPGRGGAGMIDTLVPPRPLGDGRGEQDPASVASAVYVLERLQEKFDPEDDAMQFFTILYVTLNSRTGEMRIASGGHPSPIITRQDQSPMLLTDLEGPTIGLIPADVDIPFTEAELQLEPGDQLLLYSDGLIEAYNDERVLFGVDRLKEVISSTDGQPVNGVLQAVRNAVKQWRGVVSQKDDETLLCIRRNQPSDCLSSECG